MSTIFTRLPIVSGDPTLRRLDPADVEGLNGLEIGAYDHWVFGGSSASLAGAVNGKSLTPQATPTYGANYVRINNAVSSALLTDIVDTAMPADCYCMVVRPNTGTASGLLLSTYTGTQGFMIYKLSNLLYQLHGAAPASTTLPVTDAVWRFVAVSRDLPNQQLIHYVGGSGGVAMAKTSYVPPTTPTPVGLGRNAYASSGGGTLDYAEFAAFDRPMTIADIGVLYARSKARMAKRGISVI